MKPLFEAMMENCILMNKVRVPDGEGGFVTTWEEGAPFMGAIIADDTTVARVAEQQGINGIFRITTNRSVKLEFHDVVKRVRDGQYFRVTSESGDKMAPTITSLDIAQVSAERWRLTT